MMPNVPELTFLLHAIGQCTSSSIMYSRSRPSEIEILLPVRVFLVKKIEVKIKKLRRALSRKTSRQGRRAVVVLSLES